MDTDPNPDLDVESGLCCLHPDTGESVSCLEWTLVTCCSPVTCFYMGLAFLGAALAVRLWLCDSLCFF